MVSPAMGYVVPHGASPNGDGMRVNQYTLIMDVYFPGSSSGTFRSLFQTDNEDFADFYLNPGNAVGVSGDYAGEVAPDAWHRVALAFDVGGKVPTVLKYVDGVKGGRQTLAQGRDGRWSLGSTLTQFQDPAGESQMGYLNSLQIRDRALSEGELRLLGPPTSSGIPTHDRPSWPFVEKMEPTPGAFGVAAGADIEVEILDGQNPLERGTVGLAINQRAVTPDISKTGNRTLVRYQPGSELEQNTNRVILTYRAGTNWVTNAWSFMSRTSEQKHAITGQWDFDTGDLSATIGRPLQLMDGPKGASARAVEFNTTTGFKIPDIGGKPARVLRFAGATTRSIGLLMDHGILPNGGGGQGITRVNQWTLILDLLIPNTNDERWFALLQSDLSNTSDTDFCVSFNNQTGGIGIRGQYEGEGAIVPGRWHRIAVAMNVTEGIMEKYIDGSLFAVQQLPDSEREVDGRFSLSSSALLFADEDGESQVAYVNSIQIRNYSMDVDEVRAAGGPAAEGISTNSVPLTGK
jgi:hypothetical protein